MSTPGRGRGLAEPATSAARREHAAMESGTYTNCFTGTRCVAFGVPEDARFGRQHNALAGFIYADFFLFLVLVGVAKVRVQTPRPIAL